MLTDYKITTYQKNIVDLADTPNDSGLSPEQLKAMFDGRTDNEVKNAINGIVDTLGSTTDGASGADNIGSAEITGLNEVGTSTTAKTVFKQIKSIFTALTAHIARADNPHAVTKAQVGLGNCGNTSDADKPISTATQTALDLKVDKVTGKGLSANDLSDILKAGYDGAVEKEHLHANMALLNSYTQSESNLANAVSKTHDHENKTALDTITATLITAWNNAVTKAHEHSNKTTLDAITSTVKSGYDSLVTMFTGKSISTTLGNDHTTIPTSKAVADAIASSGGGDMLRAVYDTTNNGIVDNSEKLNGHADTYFVPAVSGKGLSANDYTSAEKSKLEGIATGANATTITNNLITSATGTALDAAQGKVLKDLADGHIAKGINTENGIHGLRYYNYVLSYYNGTAWIEIETGSGGVAPGNVSGINIAPVSAVLKIKFTDPDDTAWAGTKVVMKAGSYPNNERDGTVILDNTTKNTYSENPFTQSGLTHGTTYYFGFFPYSADGAVNYNVANRGIGTLGAYRTMGITIDLANSNPATSLTYTDDAVEMTPGSAAWDDFFGHYPVLLNNGAEVGKLNKNDYTKFENGTAADITSGSAGDVMVAFPRRGVKITTVGTTMTIKMTDDPDNADFEYLAHTRGSTRKEKFYLGAYKGNTISSKLRSLSGKTPTAIQTIGTFRTQAQANGAGYEQSGFYQLVFRQAMYLLKYKNLNSQVAVGRGYVDGDSAAIATGGTNAKGMDFGETTGKLQMKLFGIEDFWGHIYECIDGIVTTSTINMLTATTGFNDTGSGYTDQGQGATSSIGGYMNKPQGSTKTGFLAKEVSGSETTYFCDYVCLGASCVACFGGGCSDASDAGAFSLYVVDTASDSGADVAARLMYL